MSDLIRREDALKELWRPFDLSRNEIDMNIHGIPAVNAVEVPKGEESVFRLVAAERKRQRELWGDQSDRPLFEFMSILGEEYGELCEAVNETCFENPRHPERGGPSAIIREAAQVAAVAIQIIEAMTGGDDP